MFYKKKMSIIIILNIDSKNFMFDTLMAYGLN